MAEQGADSAKPRRKEKKSGGFLIIAFKLTFKAVRAVFLCMWRIVKAAWRAALPRKRRRRKPDEEQQVEEMEQPIGLIDRVFNAVQRSDRVWLPSVTLTLVMAGAVLSLIHQPSLIPSQSTCVLRERIGLRNLQDEWESVRRWCDLIMESATRYQHDPHLLAALILVESGGNALAYSRDGAVGLMQVMPRDGLAAEFMCPTGPCFARRPSIAELQDPAFNIDYGAQLLRFNITRTGSVRDGLRSYGPIYVGYSYADLVLNTYHAVKP